MVVVPWVFVLCAWFPNGLVVVLITREVHLTRTEENIHHMRSLVLRLESLLLMDIFEF